MRGYSAGITAEYDKRGILDPGEENGRIHEKASGTEKQKRRVSYKNVSPDTLILTAPDSERPVWGFFLQYTI